MYEGLISKLFGVACSVLGLDSDLIHIEVVFASQNEMSRLNKQYRGKDKPTDVLSFPMLSLTPNQVIVPKDFPHDVNPVTKKIELGSIVICEDIARLHAEEYGHDITREIAFLYVHGMLHLLGYTHEQEKDEEVMVRLGENILEKAGIVRK